LNSISGKRYESLANSFRHDPREGERAGPKGPIPVRPGNTRRLLRCRGQAQERQPDMCKKARKTTAMALRPGKKGIHFITSIAAEPGKRKPFPCGKQKGTAEAGSRAILPQRGRPAYCLY